ncbi:MAG: LysR family transcriptional regulator [Pseudomonadota bacterium]
MQSLPWDALETLLAAARAGSFTKAARQLAVDTTTVARRIKRLEEAAGTQLILRSSDGKLRLTGPGQAAVAGAAGMEREAVQIAQSLGQAPAVAGVVRLTTVPILINRLLMPALPRLLSAHPKLIVEFLPEARNMSLTHREADLALRLARPTEGGSRVKTRNLGDLSFAPYAKIDRASEDLPWIGYDAEAAHLPQAQWTEATGGPFAPIRVNDLETARSAAIAGLGRALLPVCAAGPLLATCAPPPKAPAIPKRPIWLLRHADQVGQPAVEALLLWLGQLRFDMEA